MSNEEKLMVIPLSQKYFDFSQQINPHLRTSLREKWTAKGYSFEGTLSLRKQPERGASTPPLVEMGRNFKPLLDTLVNHAPLVRERCHRESGILPPPAGI